MQDSERDTDIKKRLLGSVGEGKGGKIRENSIESSGMTLHESSTTVSRRVKKEDEK